MKEQPLIKKKFEGNLLIWALKTRVMKFIKKKKKMITFPLV